MSRSRTAPWTAPPGDGHRSLETPAGLGGAFDERVDRAPVDLTVQADASQRAWGRDLRRGVERAGQPLGGAELQTGGQLGRGTDLGVVQRDVPGEDVVANASVDAEGPVQRRAGGRERESLATAERHVVGRQLERSVVQRPLGPHGAVQLHARPAREAGRHQRRSVRRQRGGKRPAGAPARSGVDVGRGAHGAAPAAVGHVHRHGRGDGAGKRPAGQLRGDQSRVQDDRTLDLVHVDPGRDQAAVPDVQPAGDAATGAVGHRSLGPAALDAGPPGSRQAEVGVLHLGLDRERRQADVGGERQGTVVAGQPTGSLDRAAGACDLERLEAQIGKRVRRVAQPHAHADEAQLAQVGADRQAAGVAAAQVAQLLAVDVDVGVLDRDPQRQVAGQQGGGEPGQLGAPQRGVHAGAFDADAAQLHGAPGVAGAVAPVDRPAGALGRAARLLQQPAASGRRSRHENRDENQRDEHEEGQERASGHHCRATPRDGAGASWYHRPGHVLNVADTTGGHPSRPGETAHLL
ncbi:MAG: hypothetical protein U5J97_06245 [Trueperaceae bacterium]|nr:hypothetical protein [Trueperaceae bacterium]